MKNTFLIIFILLNINAFAQREKKIRQLLTIDTVNVTIRDAQAQQYPYTEERPDSDAIVKKRFFADGSVVERDYYGYYNKPPQYSRIVFDEKTKRYILYPAYEGFKPSKTHFTFNSQLSLGWVNRLPKRQNEYGQSLPPDDIFSWGESINTSYDPYTIFRPSFGTLNSLVYSSPLFKKAFLDLGYTNVLNKGVVPESSSITNDFKLNISDIYVSWLANAEIGIKANYSETRNKLTENGSNYAHLFYDIACTPPDFDNSRGGYSGGKAYTNADGTEHRYTNAVDNPYRYIANNLDKESHRKASIVFSLANQSWDWVIGYDYNKQNIQSGLMPYALNMIENANGREETTKTLNSKLQYKYTFFDNKPYYELNKLLYSTLYINYNFNTTNYNADYTQAGILSLNRITNDVGISWRNEEAAYDVILYNFWLNVHNSNTLSKAKVFLNEGLNLTFSFDNVFYDWDIYNLRLKLRYSFSHTQNEAPLYYKQPYYAGTIFNTEDFRNYREQFPLYSASDLNTEATLRHEIGLDFGSDSYYNNWGNFMLNYFWDKTKNGILPVFQNNRFELNNAVDWSKEGWEITYNNSGDLRFLDWDWYKTEWNIDVNFTTYKTMVKRLLVNNNRIPIVGFSDVAISVLEGQPYGVIYGEKTDGTMGVIGNPAPDYVLNFNFGLRWENWKFNCSLGYTKGGDCWNGTLNTMNYLGVSNQSALNRSARTPFDSPYYSKGIIGIAEEAIEDASTLRFHSISLSYDLSKYIEIPELILSFGVNNLILWSAYSGVDAARPLFGYAAAQGLD
ncbi:MAG: hypothetical protein FWH39_04225, partial [Bacteroidales bacterium]|nr:hypothetical protein [Bacteroidales bacterium]